MFVASLALSPSICFLLGFRFPFKQADIFPSFPPIIQTSSSFPRDFFCFFLFFWTLLQMAVSVSVLTILSLDSGSSNRLAAPSCSSKLSSSPSLQFPLRPRKSRFANTGFCSPSRPRVLPLVKAKKQSFSSFDDLLANSDKPVLVDFYATWCGPCQFMGPVLNEVSARLQDTIQVVKIDTEKNPSVADKFRIEALPTFILFKDGEPYDRFEGALNADQLVQRLENSLKVKQ